MTPPVDWLAEGGRGYGDMLPTVGGHLPGHARCVAAASCENVVGIVVVFECRTLVVARRHGVLLGENHSCRPEA